MKQLKNKISYFKINSTFIQIECLSLRNNFIRDMADIDANLYMQGHNHYCSFDSNYRRGYDDGDRRYYAFTGHFLKYDGYARDKGLPMSQPSFLRLTIDNKLHIDCKKYYKDEVM